LNNQKTKIIKFKYQTQEKTVHINTQLIHKITGN